MKNTPRIVIIIFLISFSFSACIQDEVIPIDSNNMIIGSWIEPEYTSSESTYSVCYKRASALQDNKPGISFLVNAVYVNRNSGWCGTPPLTYFDSPGTWSQSNSIISLNFDEHSSEQNRVRWEIIMLDDEKLILERVVDPKLNH